MKTLKQFTEQEVMFKDVQNYLIATLEKQALNDVFNGNSTDGYKEAKKTLTEAFKSLKNEFKQERKEDSMSESV